MPESNANKPVMITRGFADRTKAAVRDFEARGPQAPGRRGKIRSVGGGVSKCGQVIACDMNSGYAEVKIATGGTLGGTLTLGTETVIAWIGKGSFIRTGDPVILTAIENVDPPWFAHTPITGIIYEEPEAAWLADIQDNPEVDPDACPDEVEP